MKSTRNTRAHLGLESLEERCNPSSFVQNGMLLIEGTSGHDNVSITLQAGNYKVVDNGVTTLYTPAQVFAGKVRFQGYDGNDSFSHDTNLTVFAYGMNGNDYFLGGSGRDGFDGGSGQDVLIGAGGDDYLIGGDGNDRLYAGEGDDALFGGAGDDLLYGNAGLDEVYGEAGDDTLDGGDDGVKDILEGGPGNDQFQRETYWNGFWWVNRDKPVDFVAGDSYYG